MWRGMNVSFRDMLFLLVFAYLVISAVALAHVAKKNEASAKNQMAPPGHVIVELTWIMPSMRTSTCGCRARATCRWATRTNPA